MILITRPKEESQNLSEKIRDLGYDSHIEPLSKIILKKINIKFKKNSIYLISSPRIVEVMIKNFSQTKNLKLLIIGLNSSEKIKNANFKNIIFTAKNSNELISYLKSSYIKSIEYLTGSIRTNNLCKQINRLDIKLNLQIVYETKFKKSLSKKCQNLIINREIAYVLIYSTANAKHLIRLLRETNLEQEAKHIIYVCLSRNIARELIKEGFLTKYSETPTELGLLKKLQKVEKNRKN